MEVVPGSSFSTELVLPQNWYYYWLKPGKPLPLAMWSSSSTERRDCVF
jgi:hypothetical protein